MSIQQAYKKKYRSWSWSLNYLKNKSPHMKTGEDIQKKEMIAEIV